MNGINTFEKKETYVTLNIHWGYLDNQGNCVIKGQGICEVTLSESEKSNKLTYLETRGELTLKVNKISLSTDVINLQFSGNKFIIGTDYILPVDVTRALGIPDYIIREGEYSFKDDGKVILISFPL